MRITIDPGHGGHDSGAVGPTGLHEAAVVLQIGLALEARLLAAGHIVQMTRRDDRFVELDARATMSNKFDSDLFVALHCNAAASRDAKGYEVWTTPGQTRADGLATDLFIALGRAFPGEEGRKDLADGDPDRESRFRVLTQTWAPAVLVEFGFISHPATEAKMRTQPWRDAAVRGVLEGIAGWSGGRKAVAV